ncbi:MAG: hypothetical protein ACTS5I_11730 [Rhodanobacter sp.]
MTPPIAIWFHCLFCLGDPPTMLPHAISVIHDQLEMLESSGLMAAAVEFHVGVNGGAESRVFIESMFPTKRNVIYHGLQCRTELRTLMHLQKTMKGRKGWRVLYFHSKGASAAADDQMRTNWRNCMMRSLVDNWRVCVHTLGKSVDSVGCHWKEGQVDGTQNLWGGNFWWATSDFLNTLPPIEAHPRIPIMGGVDALESRYEAECWLGSSGSRRPRVRDFHPSGPFNCVG